jgi:hypothetical protein
MKNGGSNDVKKCFHCSKEGHMSYNCPEFSNQPNAFRNGNQKMAPNGSRVNHVNAETAQEAPEVMLGTFSVNSIPATILFDSGASHSFISQAFIRNHSEFPGWYYTSFILLPLC